MDSGASTAADTGSVAPIGGDDWRFGSYDGRLRDAVLPQDGHRLRDGLVRVRAQQAGQPAVLAAQPLAHRLLLARAGRKLERVSHSLKTRSRLSGLSRREALRHL